ncbi:MAG: hypothetical protein A2X13_11430 [Bacteroidetes bacterium GWC2_33_15]|nr:MAG: hypothetical protein A2X10_05455 [Bacteroidetes bacterium GWA2_33_15]OFX50752.1 MAG: hypothetical protein A2X13_11430 [Bacteroidetes bacterium GWC2_33_15]OFX62966.1 MAG: hypothetical protein A2X15_09940 [Bacteroidetes bacterium GWB2_32_14]OFX70035.1 MAG: hypothetical protein A2X14_02800 [Bacteroidetes bacterium GWD2_33_33]HAN19035.1 hypothetical protein [Bacteroidales bacterium]
MKMKNIPTLIVVAILITSVLITESCTTDDPTTDSPIIVTEDTPVTDYDGNTYKTVKIGDQIWMAENLRSKHYSDGTSINYINYNNDTTNVYIYGRLYTQSAAIRGTSGSNTNPSNIQGVAPEGWHIPSKAEWNQLIDYLGGINVAGGSMKESGTIHWVSPNTGTNESLFTALPAGLYNFDNTFVWRGNHCVFATSTTQIAVMLQNSVSKVVVGSSHPLDGVSVRCVKD